MPAAVHVAANEPRHSSLAVTAPSATTVSAMFFVVTHSGISSADGTWVCVSVSSVWSVHQAGRRSLPAFR